MTVLPQSQDNFRFFRSYDSHCRDLSSSSPRASTVLGIQFPPALIRNPVHVALVLLRQRGILLLRRQRRRWMMTVVVLRLMVNGSRLMVYSRWRVVVPALTFFAVL